MDPHTGPGRRVAEGTSSVTDAFGNKVTGTSIKVHHRPGGESSFSLGGGYGGEGSVLDKKPAAASAAVGQPAAQEEVKVDAQQEVQAESGSTGAAASSAAPATRTIAPGTASVTDAFGNKVTGTSVRVHAPPGGKSSITF